VACALAGKARAVHPMSRLDANNRI